MLSLIKRAAWVPVSVALTGLLITPQLAAAMDEIVVKTRKRAENLQEVPIAIDVLSAEEIEREGITDLREITKRVPSLQFQTGFSPQDTKITLRGLSPTRGRVNVAVLLDGVDITSESIETVGGSLLIDPELYDIEQIEVVKGPQNALYGRSAFAGALSYRTRRPSEEFDAEIGTEVANDDRYRITGRMSGPLMGETLGGSVSGAWYDRGGRYDNGITDAEVGGSDGYSLASDLVWRPADNIEVLGRVSYSDDNYDVQPWAFVDPNTQFEIPQEAFDIGLFTPGFFPDAGSDAAGNPASVSELLQIPGILDLEPGFVPGVKGEFPNAGNKGTMSQDARRCVDEFDPSTCNDFAGVEREVSRYQLNVDWDWNGFPTGPVTFSSISHYADSDVTQAHDANATGTVSTLPFQGEVRFDTNNELFSQELRLTSNSEGAVNWVIGGLYWDEQIDQSSRGNNCIAVTHPLAPNDAGIAGFTPPLPLLPCASFMADIGPQGIYPDFAKKWSRDTEHWSAYFLVQWQVSDSLSLDLEGRYVDEELTVGGPDGDTVIDPYGLFLNPDTTGCVEYEPAPGFPVPGSCIAPRPTGVTKADEDDNFFVPKATLKWTPLDNVMNYFYVAEAKKAKGIAALNGGIGPFLPEANRFDREEQTVFELGTKTDWFDGALTFNVAGFYYDYDKKHVPTQVQLENGLITTRVTNAGGAEVYGLELESTWQATENLLLSAGYTYLDTEYTDFKVNTGSAGQIAYSGGCTPVTFDNGDQRCRISYDGNNLEDAPENAFVGSARYERAWNSQVDWFLEGNSEYLDERFVAADNNLALDSYWLFDARAGLTSDEWEVVAFVDNVLDDDTVKSGLNNIDQRYLAVDALTFAVLVPNSARYLLPEPRTYGVRFNYRFGGQ